MATQQELINDILARVQAMQSEQGALMETVSEARIKALISQTLDGVDDNSPFFRKIKFGTADTSLSTSKFARWNYSQADIEFAYDLQNALIGRARLNGGVYNGPSQELTRAFKAVSNAYYMTDEQVRAIDIQALDDLWPRIPLHEQRAMPRDKWVERAASMAGSESGFGQQLLGAQYVGDMWDAAFQDAKIAPLIPSFEMTAPTAYLPVAVDMPKMLFVGESASDVLATAQYATARTGSQRVTVTAKKFVVHQVWSGELDEDSIAPYIPYLRLQAARGIGFWTDYAILNGDDTNAGTGNINSDDADPADTEPYLAFDGIRHAAIVDNTANVKSLAGAALTLLTFRDLKGLMRDDTRKVDFGHPNVPGDLVFVTDVETGDRAAVLDEIVESKTKNGSNANLLNGEVGSFLGHPIISTMALDKTDTDYKYTTTSPSTADIYGQVTAFNRNAFVLGNRRRLRMSTSMIDASDQIRIVYSARLGFGRYTPTGAASGIEGAAVAGYIGL